VADARAGELVQSPCRLGVGDVGGQVQPRLDHRQGVAASGCEEDVERADLGAAVRTAQPPYDDLDLTAECRYGPAPAVFDLEIAATLTRARGQACGLDLRAHLGERRSFPLSDEFVQAGVRLARRQIRHIEFEHAKVDSDYHREGSFLCDVSTTPRKRSPPRLSTNP